MSWRRWRRQPRFRTGSALKGILADSVWRSRDPAGTARQPQVTLRKRGDLARGRPGAIESAAPLLMARVIVTGMMVCVIAG